MRFRLIAMLLPAAVAAAGFLSLSLTHGQAQPIAPGAPPPPTAPPTKTAPPPIILTGGSNGPVETKPIPATTPADSPSASHDLSSLTDAQKQVLLSCRRGAEWLYNMNRIDGRFRYGYVPALGHDLEGDHYLRQVGAAFGLARAARFTGDKRYNVRATQAILALLDDTTVDDPKNPRIRYTTLPSPLVNRLGSAGLLVLAISELPSPQADLLDKAEQLCNYIRKQSQPDGSLSYADAGAEGKPGQEDSDGVNYYPGEALCALMASQRHRPAVWKTELARKAVAYYHPWWRKNKNMAFVPWQTAAYAEAYVATKEQAFADCVNEMNDWLCELQYTQTDQRHPEWRGGFRNGSDRAKVEAAPQIGSAVYVESLAEACRMARQAGDVKRFDRYSAAADECLRFLSLLQYTEGNSSHFDENYRKRLIGGFFASHQDGNLRIDYTQHAVSAMVLYLECVAK
jgi:hypothetical protein